MLCMSCKNSHAVLCCEHDIVGYNLFQLQYIGKPYQNATLFDSFEFTFVSDEIQLVLEQKQTKDSWIISPQSYPCRVRNCIMIVLF